MPNIPLSFMLKNLFLIALTMFPLLCAAQEGPQYYNDNWEQTNKRRATYYRIITKEDTIFKVEDHFASGALYRTGYRTSVESEVYLYRTGHYTFYDVDESGFKVREGDYLSGRRSAIWQNYYKHSDVVKSKTYYEHDTIVGTVFQYDSATHKINEMAEYINGSLKRTLTIKGNDTTVKVEKEVKKKEKDRVDTVYYESGKIKKLTTFKDNIKTESKCYDESGLLMACVGDEPKDVIFHYVEKMPHTPYDLGSYLSKNIKYPKLAREENVSGRVIVKFVIDEDGTVCDVNLNKGIGGGCDEEAMRVVTEMPPWTPGRQNGQAVRVYFTLPIVFKLQ